MDAQKRIMAQLTYDDDIPDPEEELTFPAEDDAADFYKAAGKRHHPEDELD